MPSKPPGRLDLWVVARFLGALVQPDGTPRPMSRARLQAAARVNYDIYRAYEEALVENGLLLLEPPARVALTARGVEMHQRLLRLLADLFETGAEQ